MSDSTVKVKRQVKLTPDGVQNLTILCIFIVVCIVGVFFEPKLFLSSTNILNIFTNSATTIITAAAVTLVLNTGNLNLSVGGMASMAGVLFALFTKTGTGFMPSMLLTLLIAAGFGLLCGFLIGRFDLPSFIITLAFSYVFRGIGQIIAHGAIYYTDSTLVGFFGGTIWGGFPLPMLYALIVTALFIFIQTKTTYGSKCYAVGANITAARLSGISSVSVITIVFGLSSLTAAFAGILFCCRIACGDSNIFPALHADAIVAAVLGGTDVNGGRGTVVGMLIGALLITVLTNIMNMQDVTTYVQDSVKGVVLILAILLNNIIRERVRV
ncbi:MAG: ABC transporter permease [Eubacterium sp.]|nr:ABC transporter permease [Eubacterium sp.]